MDSTDKLFAILALAGMGVIMGVGMYLTIFLFQALGILLGR